MSGRRLALMPMVLLWLAAGAAAAAQGPVAKNPLEGNPDAIQAGMGLFRARCADCHGMDARGVRGPDLTQVWASGRTDDGLFQTLRNGVPGTEMPAFRRRGPPTTRSGRSWPTCARSRRRRRPIRRAATPRTASGCSAQRARLPRVNGVGGRLGPDLSRIGIGARPRACWCAGSAARVEDFRPGYEPVTVTPPNGQPIQGVKKNEDLFSVQIMDSRERIQGYLKDDVRAVANGKQSAMPVFGPDRLSESDLDDLLRYLRRCAGSIRR